MYAKIIEAQTDNLNKCRNEGDGYPQYAGMAQAIIGGMGDEVARAKRLMESGNTDGALRALDEALLIALKAR